MGHKPTNFYHKTGWNECKKAFINLYMNLQASLFLQRRHINNEAILHVTFQQTVISFIDIVYVNHLDICRDIVFSTKIQHLLSLCNAANCGTGKALTTWDKTESSDGKRMFRCSNEG